MLDTAPLLASCLAVAGPVIATAPDDAPDEVAPSAASFSAPVQLEAGGEPVRTEAPGYAFPCWTDVDGDGLEDLVVGQFAGGRMKVYRNTGEEGLATGEWLRADGEIAKVPGVW